MNEKLNPKYIAVVLRWDNIYCTGPLLCSIYPYDDLSLANDRMEKWWNQLSLEEKLKTRMFVTDTDIDLKNIIVFHPGEPYVTEIPVMPNKYFDSKPLSPKDRRYVVSCYDLEAKDVEENDLLYEAFFTSLEEANAIAERKWEALSNEEREITAIAVGMLTLKCLRTPFMYDRNGKLDWSNYIAIKRVDGGARFNID